MPLYGPLTLMQTSPLFIMILRVMQVIVMKLTQKEYNKSLIELFRMQTGLWKRSVLWLIRNTERQYLYGIEHIYNDNKKWILLLKSWKTVHNDVRMIYCGKLLYKFFTLGWGGGRSHVKRSGMLVVLFRSIKSTILVLLGVFRTQYHYY